MDEENPPELPIDIDEQIHEAKRNMRERKERGPRRIRLYKTVQEGRTTKTTQAPTGIDDEFREKGYY